MMNSWKFKELIFRHSMELIHEFHGINSGIDSENHGIPRVNSGVHGERPRAQGRNRRVMKGHDLEGRVMFTID